MANGQNASALARPAKDRAVAEGVAAITRTGGKQIYRIAFSFRGVECRERIALPHTRSNDVHCIRLRAEILGQIARGTFDYTQFFPESPKSQLFGHARPRRTVGRALADYRDRTEATLEVSTWRCYRRDIDNVLIPEFGHLQLSELKAGDIRDWVGRQTVGLKRLRNMILPLRAVCAEAVEDGILPNSPAAAVRLAKLVPIDARTSDWEPNPYTEAELRILLCNLPEPERWAFQLWAYTGLRSGELIGLRWPRIDLASKRLSVTETTTLGLDKARTKTKAGMRTMPLLPAAVEAIERMAPHTRAEGDRFTINPRGLKEDGAWGNNNLASVWSKAHRRTGIAVRNPYQLRHTFASNLLSQGDNAALIAKLLGHATTETVTRSYARWVCEGQELGFERPARTFGMTALWSA